MHYSVLDSGVELTAPLIYMWEIHDLQGKLVGRYIGKANGGDRRPTQHYPRNVSKLLEGKPYKKGKNYRRVHYGLSDAVSAGHRISLTYPRPQQDRPRARISLKLVQTTPHTETVELAWDGSESQIETALEAEREVLRARGDDPKF